MIEWRFKPNSRDDKNVDPIQGEFFTTRDVGNISNALIRESIQNALDERPRNNISNGTFEPVKARIFLSGNKYSLTPEKYLPYLKTLIPHLQAKNNGLESPPDLKSPMKFLVFEDFKTKGLVGDPDEYYVENTSDKIDHNFYYFWRNVGRSGKSDDQLGRWGLGKTVFPACSNINAFWGVTVRNTDKKKLLMGQCVLRIHNMEGDKKVECGYRPYGDFGKYTGNDYFAYPVDSSKQIIDEFESLFHLERKLNPGLSIIIPFCSSELTLNHLGYSVIEQYFYPILEGKLEIEIEEEDKKLKLTKESLLKSLDEIDFEKLSNSEDMKVKSKDSMLKLFDFARWTFQLKDDDFYKLNPLAVSHKPRWNKSMFPDSEDLNKLRERFDTGERIAIMIPIKYHPVGSNPITCWYNAYLEKDQNISKPESLFVRDGITISGITSLDKGLVRGMVIIHDSNLARMLGDSENPAHTEWQADSRNFKGKYVDGKEALVFVKNTLKSIFEKLQKPLDGLQKDLLIDFFSIPIPTEKEKRDRILPDDDSGDDEVNESDINIPKTRKTTPYLLQKIHTGIRVYRNEKATEIPESIHLKLGYDIPRGNPIKNYQPLDFDISKKPIHIESQGVYFTKKEANNLEFDIEDISLFEIKLTGFDEKRDLVVQLI